MSAFTDRLRRLDAKATSGVLVVGPAAELALRLQLRNALPAIIDALEAVEQFEKNPKDEGGFHRNILWHRLNALDALVEDKAPLP